MVTLEARTQEEFERDVVRSEDESVVLFWASWCSFCQAFRPVFEALVQRYAARFVVAWLDDYGSPLWDTYGIDVVPSLALFRGGVLVARKDGRLMRGLSRADLEGFLDQVLTSASAP